MLATSLIYRAAARTAALTLPLLRGLSPKLRVGDLGRRGALARWISWSRTHRTPARPLLWIHAASVGEGLQAEAVISVLRHRHPEWQIAYTFFSPSAEPLAHRLPVDHADYLPYDTRSNVDTLLRALSPDVLIFTKLDLWPELATRAARRGVRVGLIAGTVSEVSGRRHPIARRLTRPGYAVLDGVGAIAEADAQRLAHLGAVADRIIITGDPRFDSVLAKLSAMPHDAPGDRLTRGATTLVAGSTWEGDERVLAEAWCRVRAQHDDARLILVPHEPTPAHVTRLITLLGRDGTRAVPLSELADGEAVPPVVIVDRIGILAGLYRGAAAAFVGGGFGEAGLHSVIEPAACGVPVIFGPHWRSSREAGLLLRTGAAVALPESEAGAAPALADLWNTWLGSPTEREIAGRAARATVDSERGGALRNATLVESLMTEATSPNDRSQPLRKPPSSEQ